MKLRILSYNIRLGGAGREKHISRVISACEPDIVVLQEAVRPDVVARISGNTGMQQWGATSGESVAFLSRIRVTHYAWHHVSFGRRRYLEVVPEAPPMHVFGVHLSAIHSNVTERRRVLEMRALLSDLRPHRETMHIVTGDFNTIAPGEVLQTSRLPLRLRALMWFTGGAVEWKALQLMLDAGYADAYRQFHRDPGYTFPTWDPHVRLDYCFVPGGWKQRLQRCAVVTDVAGLREASDHFPLLTEITDR